MSPLLFGCLAVLLVSSGLGVILARSPIRSALSLVMTLFFLAVMFLLLDAQLVAVLQVIVYAGAIMVLFLFVIMLLNLQEEPVAMARVSVRCAAGLAGSLFLLAAVRFFRSGAPQDPATGMGGAVGADFGGTAQVGERLFTHYLLAFEITSFLLLVAMVSAVVLAKKTLV